MEELTDKEKIILMNCLDAYDTFLYNVRYQAPDIFLDKEIEDIIYHIKEKLELCDYN